VHRWAEEDERGHTQKEIFALVYEEVEKRLEHMNDREIERIELMITVLPSVFAAHKAVWGDVDKYLEPQESERKFSMPLEHSNGWTFEGKIDGFHLDTRKGKLYQRERKTSAKTGPTYWANLLLDSQPLGYNLAANRCLGIPVTECIYDIFKKPAISKGKYETETQYFVKMAAMYASDPKKYMERGPYQGVITPLRFTEQQIEEYYWDLIQVTEELDWRLTYGVWPKKHPYGPGGCSFRPLCLAKDDDEVARLSDKLFYTRDAFHPELA
jgi:hypothetical protein